MSKVKTCVDCTHCKQKANVLAYCAKGMWQKQDGNPKHISLAYLPHSRLAHTAEYCPEYEGEEE